MRYLFFEPLGPSAQDEERFPALLPIAAWVGLGPDSPATACKCGWWGCAGVAEFDMSVARKARSCGIDVPLNQASLP